MPEQLMEFRLRSKIGAEELEMKKGKQLLPEDVNAYLTGPARVLMPDGRLLCVYLPGAISQEIRDQTYPIFHSLKDSYTSNRGLASGTERVQGPSQRSYAKGVDSAIVGAFDAKGPKQYCRLTAWTGREMEAWKGCWPLLEEVARLFALNVPDRYANQAREAQRTSPEWVIPGTPFTTVTVNNTYATGVHTDNGDLDEGFSTLTVFRRGEFKGGALCFPEYRLAIDMQEGDLLLMDAHAWHGNTRFDPEPARNSHGRLEGDPGFERISVVSYFRTNMVKCGSAADEAARARQYAENRNKALLGE